jgi:hypothetical protein
MRVYPFLLQKDLSILTSLDPRTDPRTLHINPQKYRVLSELVKMVFVASPMACWLDLSTEESVAKVSIRAKVRLAALKFKMGQYPFP